MITYRKAALPDIQELARIRCKFLEEANDVTSEEESVMVEKANIEYFRTAIGNDTFISWIALDGEEIIATSGLSFSLVPPSFRIPDGKVAYIMNMYTFPLYRNRGIATTLFRKIIEEAKLLGYRKITLKATDMGRTLYEKYGFKDVYGDMVFYL